MSDTPSLLFLGYFDAMDDPRVNRTKLHPLADVLAVAICALMCGADTWNDIEAFGTAKIEWFRTLLNLHHGIPSHDTFNRVFTRLCPEPFQACFLTWVHRVTTLTDGQVVAIDGKTRRSSADPWDGKAAIPMVSAGASAHRIILGQLKVDEKSNEITAIPALVRAIEMAGWIVTIDAMGCQRAIATTIIDADADYLLAVKDNQPKLASAIEQVFAGKLAQEPWPSDLHTEQTDDRDHGRREIRTTYTTDDLQTLWMRDAWDGLRSIAMVVAERTVHRKTSIERRYSISSTGSDPERIGNAARAHWGIENSVHWILDVAFREDASRMCKDHAPHNVAILRHSALNLVKQEKTAKLSMRTKRLRAGWDDAYLIKVLQLAESNHNASDPVNEDALALGRHHADDIQARNRP